MRAVPTRIPLVSCLCALLFVLASAQPRAQAATQQFNLPTQNLAIFGVQFQADFLAPPAGTIVEARAELHYTTTTLDAADLLISLQAPSSGVPIWQVTGASLSDLAFGILEILNDG